MIEMKVVCPNCHERLSMKFKEGLNVEKALIKCPKCSYKATLPNYQQGSAGQGGGGSSNEESTQLNLHAMDRTVGSLYIDGKEFALSKGKISIGRKAETCRAQMQIPTSDMYMSRHHAYVTVKEGPYGLEHYIEPFNPKNAIRINGNKIEQGDVVILSWGDKLMFGHTEVVFEKPRFNEEATLFEE